jgi:hypothetical protein
MPRFLVLLVALSPLTLPAQTENVASGMRLTAETRVADFTLGPVQEGLIRIVPEGDGFIATTYTLAPSRPIETQVDAGGVPHLDTRKLVSVGHISSGGRPLYVWSENDGFIYASRSPDLATLAKTRVAHGQLIRATCGDSACFFAVFGDAGLSTALGAVITDLEGRPLTSKTVLPYFSDVLSMPSVAADPDGFAYVRLDRSHRNSARAVRVDLRGHIVFDIPLRTFEPQILWIRDRYVEIGNAFVNDRWYLTAGDLSVSGELGPPRTLQPVATYFSQFQIFNDGQSIHFALIDRQQVSVFRADSGVATAMLEYVWDMPPSFYFAGIAANGRATVGVLQSQNGALYTMSATTPSTPTLLSYGPRPQVPIGVEQLESQYLVAWRERDVAAGLDKVRAARIAQGGFPLDRTPIEVGDGALIYGVAMASLRGDVLIVWSKPDLAFAIVSGDGRLIGRFKIADEPLVTSPAALIATDNDWVLFRQGGGKIVANRISRSGFVYPSVTLHDTDGSNFVAAASDGQQMIALTTKDMIILASDLTIVRRDSPPIGSGTLRFSGDSYLLAGYGHMFRLEREGRIISDGPLELHDYSVPSVAAVRGGWLTCSTKTCARVLPSNPPETTTTFEIESLKTISPAGDDHVGLLFVRPTLAPTSIGDAIYFRELELYETPRKRAIGR